LLLAHEMTHEQQDPISTAARLLREAAHELQLSHTIGGLGDWSDCEPEVIAAHGEYIAAAAGIERLAEPLGAGGVEPLRARQCLHQIAEPGGWIVVADRLPEITELCDWLMPPTELKRERWILVNECLVTASVPGAATHWRKTQPLPPSPSSAEGGSNGAV
jgi:hypothetical protein